ncbi:MAG: glycosyltransferase, partial [bacterium]|nr:glycosyltransferase [bacterium]
CLVDLGCPAQKVQVQALGVDLDRIPFVEPANRVDHAPVVLMYAALREKKGHVYGLRAFRKVQDAYPGVQVRVIGDGPLRGEIEEEIQKLGIAESVSLLGMLPHAVCTEELKRATVLLYPSVTAADGDTEGGAPVSLIEAMASGLPVVSSQHADIPFVVPEGRCGLLAKERDVDGLAEALDAVLRSEDMRGKMAWAGRRHVEAHHALVTQVGRLEEVYDRLVIKG